MSAKDDDRDRALRAEADRLMQSAALPGDDTPLAGMVSAHEMYLTAQAGGFTRNEALWMVAFVISGGTAFKGDGGDDE